MSITPRLFGQLRLALQELPDHVVETCFELSGWFSSDFKSGKMLCSPLCTLSRYCVGCIDFYASFEASIAQIRSKLYAAKQQKMLKEANTIAEICSCFKHTDLSRMPKELNNLIAEYVAPVELLLLPPFVDLSGSVPNHDDNSDSDYSDSDYESCSYFEKELAREIQHPQHTLFGIKTKAIGHTGDDVLYALEDGRFAAVHLTWNIETRNPLFPYTKIYDSSQDVFEHEILPDFCLVTKIRNNSHVVDEIAVLLRDIFFFKRRNASVWSIESMA